LDTDQQILESQQLAKKILTASNPQRRAQGDQHRTYDFPPTTSSIILRNVWNI
jgi:hypothetical protein